MTTVAGAVQSGWSVRAVERPEGQIVDRQRQIVSALLILISMAAASVWGQAPRSQAESCRETTLTGRVQRGQAFEAAFTDELVFRLEPETHPNNPPGWTIAISPAGDPQSDYAMVATPPYRFSNPRYVSTAYGITAAAALSWTPRAFAFVAGAPAFESATDALGVLLWPGNHTQAEVAQAETALKEVPTYPGRFWIEDGATTVTGDPSPRGVIDWIRFRAELCAPESPAR